MWALPSELQAYTRPHLFGRVSAHNRWLSLFPAGRSRILKGYNIQCAADVEWKEWKYRTPGQAFRFASAPRSSTQIPRVPRGSQALPAAVDGQVENKCSVQSLGERGVCEVGIKDKFILLSIDT